jgi:hypothetical protein
VLELAAAQPDLSVLIVTGHPEAAAEWERGKGCQHPVLEKPFAISDLLGRIRQSLDLAGRREPVAGGPTDR